MKSRPRDREPQTYIVRVYRRGAGGRIGHVEEVRTGAVLPFRSAATLWRAIRCASPRRV